MYNNWQEDVADSVKALESIRSTILPKVISGQIYTIENVESEILLQIDQISGIDYIRKDEAGLQGIAARVQWGNAWNTFTIRAERHTGAKTELEKRLYQIENGYLYPAYTLQAYFDNRSNNNLLSIGIIRTVDLYTTFLSHGHLFNQRCSDNVFYYIHWSAIRDKMKTYYSHIG